MLNSLASETRAILFMVLLHFIFILVGKQDFGIQKGKLCYLF